MKVLFFLLIFVTLYDNILSQKLGTAFMKHLEVLADEKTKLKIDFDDPNAGECSTSQPLTRVFQKEGEDLQTLFEKLFKKLNDVLAGNDPYHYTDIQTFNKDGYGLTLHGSGGKFVLSGIKSMNATKIVARNDDGVLHFEFNLHFGELQITGFYNFTFDFLTMVPLFGTGDCGAIFPSLEMSMTIDMMEAEHNILQVKSSNFNVNIPDIELDFENLLGIQLYSKLLTDVLNENSKDLIGASAIYMNKALNMVAKPQIDQALCDYGVTYDKMIDAIVHFIQ